MQTVITSNTNNQTTMSNTSTAGSEAKEYFAQRPRTVLEFAILDADDILTKLETDFAEVKYRFGKYSRRDFRKWLIQQIEDIINDAKG